MELIVIAITYAGGIASGYLIWGIQLREYRKKEREIVREIRTWRKKGNADQD